MSDMLPHSVARVFYRVWSLERVWEDHERSYPIFREMADKCCFAVCAGDLKWICIVILSSFVASSFDTSGYSQVEVIIWLFCCRWLCYCNVPQFCDSLPRYETTQVFGRTLLRSVFTVMRRQLLEQARQEKDKLPQEKRTLILTHFPK